MDPLKGKYTYWQRLIHQWKARKDIPFRKKFFVGYDLHGNTYWEFTIDGNMQRLRRKLEPYQPLLFKVDYFATVPPQWLQWLRRSRNDAPSLEELINDQVRQQKIKLLAQQADANWTAEKLRLESEHQAKLQRELQRAHQEDENSRQNKSLDRGNDNVEPSNDSSDPWKQADESKNSNPIAFSSIKPRN